MIVNFTIAEADSTTSSGETKYVADVSPKPDNYLQFRGIAYNGNTIRGDLTPGTEGAKSFIRLYVKDRGTLTPGNYQFDTDTRVLSRSETPAQDKSAPKTDPKVTQSPEQGTLGPGPTDPTKDPIYAAIAGAMDALVRTFDAKTTEGVDLSDFSSTDGIYYLEIRDFVNNFKKDPVSEYEHEAPIEGRLGYPDLRDKAILSIIAGYASSDKADTNTGKALQATLSTFGIKVPIEGLPQAIKNAAKSDETIKSFLIDGINDRLTGQNRPAMFNRLRDFTKFLGTDTDTEFVKVIRELEKESSTPVTSAPENAPPEEKPGESDTQKPDGDVKADTDKKTSGAETSSPAPLAPPPGQGATAPGANTPTEPPAQMGEAPKKEEPSDTIPFRYTLFGADPKSDAKMTLTFQDGSGLEYTVPSSRIGSYNSFIVNGNNREKIAANVGTYVDVKIEATPMSGGDAATDTHSIYVTKQLADNQIVSFRFMPSLSWAKNSGVDSRGRTVGELLNKEGDVRMVFYTRSGSVGVATCDVSAAVQGKTFKFNFTGNQPLLVPIQLDVTPGKLNESLVSRNRGVLNEAVPHWIFLSGGAGAQGGAGGTKGGGGRGGAGEGGGADGGKKTMNVNVAVSQLSIASEDKWIYMPNVGNPFDRKTFRFAVAPGSIKKYTAIPDAAQQVSLAAEDLTKQGYTPESIADKVYEALFEDSDAWKKVGGANLNCWSKDDTVVGGSSSITSRHAYEPVRVS